MDLDRVQENGRMARESYANAVLLGIDASTNAAEYIGSQMWNAYREMMRAWSAMFLGTQQYADDLRQQTYDTSARQASQQGQGGQGQGGQQSRSDQSGQPSQGSSSRVPSSRGASE